MYLFIFKSNNMDFEIKAKTEKEAREKVNKLLGGRHSEYSNKVKLVFLSENYSCPKCNPTYNFECNAEQG